MKNILFFIFLIFASTLYGQLDRCNNNPSIQAGDINPAPLTWQQGGTLSFTYVENLLDYTDEETDPVRVTICLLNIEPVNGVSSIGGNFSSSFTWVYDPVSNCFQGTQNRDIFGGTGGRITVDFDQTNPFLCNDNQMGFNANIQPANCMNGINETTDDNESVYTCTDPNLPLDLISFKGAEVNCEVHLSWETANEVDISHFEVEESNDGVTFSNIGRVDANGGPAYNYTDEQILRENYYRLKIIGTDGSIEYSGIVTVYSPCADDISITGVMPNPVSNTLLHINFTSNTIDHEQAKVVVTDMLSRTLMEVPVTVFKGTNQMTIDPSRLPAAPYLIRVEGNNWTTAYHKFVKLDK